MVTDELQINITADTGNAAQNITNTATALNTLGDSAKTADTDMSTLVRAMSEAAANMVTISQNIATSAAGLSGFQSSVDAVSSALTGINLRFDTLNASIQSSYGAFDSAATSVQGLSAASEASAAGLNSIVSATDNFADRMDLLSDTTHGTTAGMVSLQKEIQDTLTTMRGFADNMGNAGKDAEDASRKIKELSEQVSTLAKQSSAGNTAVMSLAAGFKSLKGIVATLGIGKFIKDSNDAYVVQMQNELKLTAHMKQRMNATDDEIKSIKELASAQQQLGVIGDEIQLAGAQQLTTYARQSSTLKTLLPAMNNLIAQNAGYEASVGDATSAADMLGRALNGQYTSLRRMGVTFTQAQEQILKYGTESQKASVLADAINSKVGNMNQLLAQTPTGQLKQLQNDFGDLQEQIGATFQPLISSLVPVLRGVMDTLAVPIKNVSTGITIIGQAIASIDSPAVRAIGLAAAGIAVMSKLKAAIGGTSAGLLLLGVILSSVIGAMSGQQETVGNIVEDAYAKATAATGQATGAAKDYDEQLQNVQKTASKLAGFDTITKLSGGSSGSLAANLFNEGDLANLNDLTDAAFNVQDALNGIEVPKINVDFKDVTQKAEKFASDLDFLFKHWGDDDAMYQPLTRMTNQIEDLLNGLGLDGTAITGFFKSLGGDIYNAFNGNEVEGFRGITKKIEDLLNASKLDGTGFVNFWKGIGSQIYDAFGGLFSAFDDLSKGNYEAAAEKMSKGINAQGGMMQFIGTVTNNPVLGWAGDNMKASADTLKATIDEGSLEKALGIITPENTEGVINRFAQFESAPLAAYYKWGSSGMPDYVPKNVVTSMGEGVRNQPTSYTDIPVQRHASQVGMPKSARQQASISVYIDGNKVQPDRTEISNGLY